MASAAVRDLNSFPDVCQPSADQACLGDLRSSYSDIGHPRTLEDTRRTLGSLFISPGRIAAGTSSLTMLAASKNDTHPSLSV